MDGTLVTRGPDVPASALAALERARRAGIEVVLATGRRFRSAHTVAEQFPERPDLVCLGGALLKAHTTRAAKQFAAPICAATGYGTLAAEGLSLAVAADVVRAAREAGHPVIVQVDHPMDAPVDFLVDDAVPWNGETAEYAALAGDAAQPVDALAHVSRHGALILSLYDTVPRIETFAGRLAERLGDRVAVHVIEAGAVHGCYCEIRPPEVDKWRGLQRLVALRRAGGATVCAVGDERNDVPMVRAADLGVAMGNAHPDLRRYADWITTGNRDDGIARLVDLLLEGR